MDELDLNISAAAEKIAPILRNQGTSWPIPVGSKPQIMPQQRLIPGVADVALVLRRLVEDLQPGTRLEEEGIAVQWTDNAETGPEEHISFSVIIHTAPAPAK